MSAYVIVEATVLDEESCRRYGSQVEPTLLRATIGASHVGSGKK